MFIDNSIVQRLSADYDLSQRDVIAAFASMSRYVAVLLVLVAVVYGFQSPAYNTNNSLRTVLLSESGGTNRDREIENRDTKNDDFLSKIPNPFRELSEMFQNFDDVLDDFLYKRMGNGEGT